MFSLQKYIHQEKMPKFNPDTANGIAVKHFDLFESFIDRVWMCVQEGLPEGLTYEGGRRCTPREQWQEETRTRYSKRTYDVSKSDVYMMRYEFKYKGETLYPLYLYLPFIQRGGLISLRGSLYNIAPVLADRAVSVGQSTIYIPLTRDKLTFYRLIHHFWVNNKQENSYVIHSPVYHKSDKSDKREQPSVKADSTLPHYLFCRYGVTETFKLFANTDVYIGTEKDVNPDKYPTKDWLICYSSGLKPRGVLKRGPYTPTDIRIAMPKNKWSTLTSGLVGGFFYILDHFPDQITSDHIDNTRLWRILMGHVIFPKETKSDGKHAIYITKHIDSLDQYIDKMAKDTLADDGIFVDNLFELFAHIIETFPDRIVNSGDDVSSMYNKRLSVLRYVAEPIIIKAFGFMYNLRNPNKKLTKDEIIKNMRMISREVIFQINHDHGEVKSVSSPNDNIIFNITSNMVMQSDSKGTGMSASIGLNDPSKYLHASLLEIGSYSHLPKSEPSGRSKINPCANTEQDGLVVGHDEFRELLNAVQHKLRRF